MEILRSIEEALQAYEERPTVEITTSVAVATTYHPRDRERLAEAISGERGPWCGGLSGYRSQPFSSSAFCLRPAALRVRIRRPLRVSSPWQMPALCGECSLLPSGWEKNRFPLAKDFHYSIAAPPSPSSVQSRPRRHP